MDPSDARDRIAAIQQRVETGEYHRSAKWGTLKAIEDAEFLLARICELESEACIKDAYAYELAKERDALDTKLSDALEALDVLKGSK